MNYIDLHCDTLWNLMDLEGRGNLMDNTGSVSINRLRQLKEKLSSEEMIQVFACFVCLSDLPGTTAEEKYEHGYTHVLDMISYFKKNWIAESGIRGLLSVEEGGVLCNSIESLQHLKQEGIKLITLLWNYENCIGYPNSRNPETMKKGLKPFGIEVVEQMGEMDMIVDVSHASDGTFWDVLHYAKGAVVASHSNCRSLCDHPRNLSDEMIRALAEQGGIAGLNLYGYFLDGSDTSKINAMVAHIKHMIHVGGSDFPALGTDFDGFHDLKQMEIPDCTKMYRLIEALEREGLRSCQIDKICFQNAKRVLSI